MPMLAQGTRTLRRARTTRLLLGTFILVVLASVMSSARADAPLVIGNPDASRTVTWTFGSTENLTAQNVSLAGGQAILPWQHRNVSWTSSAQFAANGSSDPNVRLGTAGLELAADSRNFVADGNLSAADPWAFTSSPSGWTTARWEADPGDAILGHRSASTESAWDTLDTMGANWSWYAPPSGSLGNVYQNTSGQIEGTGMMGIAFNTTAGGSWGSALRGGTVNWSAGDRVVAWINATDVVPALSFNITATVGGVFRTTSSVTLSQGWHEVVVDINPLGFPAERSSIQNVRFRITGANVPWTWIYFDDVRLASIKQIDETASMTQLIPKGNSTTPRPGSAYLSFNWSLVNRSGIVGAEGVVNVSGPAGSLEAMFTSGGLGGWKGFQADVSAITADPTLYSIRFRFHVLVDNTSESIANLRVDNVSLTWPNRRNGTYLSDPIDLGAASEYLRASWSAVLPGGTSAALQVRSGNGTNPGDPSWGHWDRWSAPGTYVPTITGADHFQIQIELNTTNASRSPQVPSFSIDTRHRADRGTITSDPFVASSDFLTWRSFNASKENAAGTTIAFSVGNGTYWSPVPPSGPVYGVQGRAFRWRAILTTDDGLRTPILTRIEVTYEFLGPVDHVRLTPSGPLDVVSGTTVEFLAAVLDSGDHAIPTAVVWSTTDPTGHVQNDGLYTAGTPGTWNVTVTVAGSPISATARVTVSAAPWSVQAVLFPYGLIALLAIAGGYGAYEIWIRRAFSIDDVFLISKDGRLMLHNTRRMRADRDEDILSGMLTAIRTFARDFDREEDGDLRRFAFGDKTTLIERGEHAYLAAVYAGRVPRWAERDLRRFMHDLERRFGSAFARWSGAPEDLQGLKELSERFVSRVRYRPS